MGYESKLYIVEKGSFKNNDGMTYARIIAMFDMSKMGSLTNIFNRKTDCYFYADDGNTKVLEDMYGNTLTEAAVEDVLHALEKTVDNGNNYRRIFPLLSALKTIYEQRKDGKWEEIVVLHYGY